MKREETISDGQHRKLAVDLFNQTWGYIEKPNRTKEEDAMMLHMAHASRFHWGFVGQPVNFSRGEWLLSRVYALLNRAEPALYHAEVNMDLIQKYKIADFDLAFAYEALARSYLVAGDRAAAQKNKSLAIEISETISNEADRNLLLADVDTIEC